MRRILMTENSFLKQLEPGDAGEMYWLTDSNRSYLKEWLPWLDYTRQVEDTAQFINMTINQHNNNQGTHYGIWYNGRLAGTLGVHNIDWINKKTSIGYWLGAQFQGKGLMTAAVATYVDRLIFGSWDLEKVTIQAATENYKSRSIPERLGFQQEGILRRNEFLYDHFVDHAVYSLLRSEWEEARNSKKR
ncbi:alanine acetyltransferase [Brevibacillus choshinensis]|uniref:Alanine acetyltransferase n=2 Tax=Brevibacillus choshinensis TaxID=54911 RepID=A0ABR5N6E3_BRECH|nr:GNAT family protein [Brevibacillus choshinensis]KQL46190.1 alanine acetyltransferase [Brevibacillus choshinensis]